MKLSQEVDNDTDTHIVILLLGFGFICPLVALMVVEGPANIPFWRYTIVGFLAFLGINTIIYAIKEIRKNLIERKFWLRVEANDPALSEKILQQHNQLQEWHKNLEQNKKNRVFIESCIYNLKKNILKNRLQGGKNDQRTN